MREQEDTGELASWWGVGGWGPHLGSSWVGSSQGHQDQGRWGRSDQKWGKLWNWTPQGGAVSCHPHPSTGRALNGSWMRAGGGEEEWREAKGPTPRRCGDKAQQPPAPQRTGVTGLFPSLRVGVPGVSMWWALSSRARIWAPRAVRLSLNLAEPPRRRAVFTH